MRFAVLGPLEVDGRALDLRPGRQRALLCALLCRPGQVVSDAELLSAVWRTEARPDAVGALQVCVHRLRHALGDPGRVVRRGGGYVLAVGPDETDVARFAALARAGVDLLAEADLPGAAATLGEALALWRGDPFVGEADTELVRDEVGRLTESRLAVLEARLAADLALGRAAEVVSELAELTTRHPLRERFHVQYMTALRHSGRRAESLAAYRRMRAVTVAELGLEPSEEARSLHESLLADATPVPTVADVRRLARVGRHTDAVAAGRAALRADLTDAARTELHETLGVCLREQGKLAAAVEHLGVALALAVTAADTAAEIRAVQMLAILERERGHLTAAHRLLARASDLHRETGDPETRACLLLSGGDLRLRANDTTARQAIDDGLALCADLNLDFGVAYATRLAGEAELAHRRHDRAVDHLVAAESLTEVAGSRFTLALTLRSLGLAHAHRGHDLDARRAWRRAAMLFGSLGNLHARREVDALALRVPQGGHTV